VLVGGFHPIQLKLRSLRLNGVVSVARLSSRTPVGLHDEQSVNCASSSNT
jgi:hypothetical protein